MEFTFVDIGALPLYDNDLWNNPPASVISLKQKIADCDAVLFVTPEYNRSLPGVLKNAIDWASFPWGQNSWAGKPAAIAGASPGAIGTAAAQAHLRSIAPVLDIVLMGQPELYLAYRPDLIDEQGGVADDGTLEFLTGFVAAFAGWIERVAAKPGGQSSSPQP
jgi:chromate reductase